MKLKERYDRPEVQLIEIEYTEVIAQSPDDPALDRYREHEGGISRSKRLWDN